MRSSRPDPPRSPARASILAYHSLDGSGSVISMDPRRFRAQMEALKARGFEAITLARLLSGWDGHEPLPGKPIVVTFDDGYGNLLDHAAPVLDALGFAATVFVIAGRVGGASDWAGQPASLPRLPLLGATDLRSLAGAGWEIGSHGMSHAPLPSLHPAGVRDELISARRRLEDLIGGAVPHFAYPYGDATPSVRSMTAEIYAAACGTTLARARRDDDRWRLPRVEMYYLRQPVTWRLLDTVAGNAYLAIRRLARAARRRNPAELARARATG